MLGCVDYQKKMKMDLLIIGRSVPNRFRINCLGSWPHYRWLSRQSWRHTASPPPPVASELPLKILEPLDLSQQRNSHSCVRELLDGRGAWFRLLTAQYFLEADFLLRHVLDFYG